MPIDDEFHLFTSVPLEKSIVLGIFSGRITTKPLGPIVFTYPDPLASYPKPEW
jgi:hypothetical protein